MGFYDFRLGEPVEVAALGQQQARESEELDCRRQLAACPSDALTRPVPLYLCTCNVMPKVE